MKKTLLLFIFLAAAFTLVSAQSRETVGIHNLTGVDVEYLFIRQAGAASWDTEYLEGGDLKNGDSITYFGVPANRANSFDILLIDKNLAVYAKTNVRGGPDRMIEFSSADSSGDFMRSSVNLMNLTGHVIWYVYISPSFSDTWGFDRLDSDQIIEHGKSATVPLPIPVAVYNEYDILLEDSEGNTYSRFSVKMTSEEQNAFLFESKDMDG